MAQVAVPAPRRPQRSLFGEILDWMLAPLLLLWPMSLALTGVVAQQIANGPYDRELGQAARSLARQVVTEPAPRPGLTPRTRLNPGRSLELLRSDDTDRVYLQVLGVRGELVAGDADLPLPQDEPVVGGGVRFRDAEMRDEPSTDPVRWCSTRRRWTSARAWPPRSSRA